MKSLSSPEVAMLVAEFQRLIGYRVSKIHSHEDSHLSFSLHSSQEKPILQVYSNVLFLSESKPSTTEATAFAKTLRKHLENGKITSITQEGFDRILRITIAKKTPYNLIFELFGKGNVILADDKNVIIAALESREWRHRSIRPKAAYVLPPAPVNTPSLSFDDLKTLAGQSSMSETVKFLAAELGLGKHYAEELCTRAAVPKTKPPSTLGATLLSRLFDELTALLKAKPSPNFVPGEEALPLSFQAHPGGKKTASFSQALALLVESQVASDPELERLEQILSEQEQTLSALLREIEDNRKLGEAVYEQYALIEGMLNTIARTKKDGWPAVKEALKTHKEFVYLDEKKGQLVLNIQ